MVFAFARSHSRGAVDNPLCRVVIFLLDTLDIPAGMPLAEPAGVKIDPRVGASKPPAGLCRPDILAD